MTPRIVNCFMFVLSSLWVSTTLSAQERAPIKDNSFLIEEAYNQEPGVIQWITTVQHFSNPTRYWGTAITQEFPLHGIRHQLSWTVPWETNVFGELEWGRVALHYRFQLEDGSSGTACAPRVSALLPTDPDYTTYSDDVWWQANLPVSIEVTESVILHLNAGVTYSPGYSSILRVDGAPNDETLMSYMFGGSVVFLAHPNWNLLTEIVYTMSDEFGNEFAIQQSEQTIVNPGLRVAVNPPIGQFVPGIAVPIRMADGETDIGVFGYLSFEHAL